MRATVRWSSPPALSIGLCFLVACASAGAADLVVRVGDRGKPVGDAVVSLVPADGTTRGAASAVPPTTTVDQRDLAFVPYVQVARPGGQAVFRNSDHTRHHVYSFSPAATFEMVLGPGERSGRVPLQEEGVVAIGCNIHDQMIAWLYVSDAPWLARTGQGGEVRFRDVPPGGYRIRVWHPRIDARGDAVERRVTLHDAASRALDIAVRLRPDARAQPDRERADY